MKKHCSVDVLKLKISVYRWGKSMKSKYLLLIITALLSGYTAANCTDKQTQTDINLCLAKEYKQADQKLNEIYSSYVKTLGKADKKLLLAAQRGWVNYKEKDCQLEASAYKGGSIYSQLVTQCLTEKTKVRIKELNNLKNCNLASTEAECQ